MKSHTKHIVWAIILLLLATWTYGFFYSDLKTPPNSFKYQNKEAGISFFYPQSFREITKIDSEIVRLALPTTELSSVEIPETITFLKPEIITKPSDLEKVLLSKVIFDGSGEHPDSVGQFGQADINGQRFYFIQSGRFEGILSYEYFLAKDTVVLPISIRWYIGDRWMDPTFEIKDDPRYKELIGILSTLKVN
jgi:hypothetical protein